MAKVVVMPKLGYTQDKGQITEWHKQVGDDVTRGEPFFNVHTDKSVITVDANCSGTLLKIALEPYETVPVLTPVAVVGEKGEDADAILAAYVTTVAADAQVEADFDNVGKTDSETEASVASAGDLSDIKLTPRAKRYIMENNIDLASVARIKGTGFQDGVTERDIKASPLARKAAAALGVNLADVQGTGANGKIIKEDVTRTAAPVCANENLQIAGIAPFAGVRKIIGEKLAFSKFTAPHLYFTDAVDVTNITALRKQLNDMCEVKIAVSDLLTMAACKALKKFPGINVTLRDEQIVTYKSINIGTAVAGSNGLIVPVIKNVQNKTLTDVARESRDLVSRAKEGRLAPEEYSDGTFTISNLGMFGIGNFTAIINAPESAILSVSSVRKMPVVITDENNEDTIAIRPMMNIQLSVDHRLIDGLLASQFVEYMKELLENPLHILM